MFPHIFALIVEHVPIDALLSLRATCRGLRRQVDPTRLALHVVVEGTEVYTRYGGISLRDRSELVQYMRVLDLKQLRINDYVVDDNLALDSITAIEDIARKANNYGCNMKALEIDLVRLLPDERLFCIDTPPHVAFVHAKRTVYFVNLDDGTHYGETHIPFSPIAGSQEVVLNIQYDARSPYTACSDIYVQNRASRSTVVLFSAREHDSPGPSYAAPHPSASPTHHPHLALEMAKAVSSGVVWGPPGARVTVVGIEQWPVEWFFLPFGPVMQDGEQETIFRLYFESYHNDLVAEKLGSDYDDLSDTESELDEEMAAKLSYVSLSDYKEVWSSLHPDGLSIVTRP